MTLVPVRVLGELDVSMVPIPLPGELNLMLWNSMRDLQVDLLRYQRQDVSVMQVLDQYQEAADDLCELLLHMAVASQGVEDEEQAHVIVIQLQQPHNFHFAKALNSQGMMLLHTDFQVVLIAVE
jgi:hypothetical protein